MRLLKHKKKKGGKKNSLENQQTQVAVKVEESKRLLDNIKIR